MEAILGLYEEEPDPDRPRVCFDEQPYQMLSHVQEPLPPKPGVAERYDYEYQREGTCNLFLFVCPERGWREVKVTPRRTGVDFAHCMRDLVDVHFPEARKVRVILDNLNTHTPASLYEAFEPAEAMRILQRIEFHYTPKHGSWLNMAEIELSALTRQCMKRRLPDIATVAREVAAWVKPRNAARTIVKWLFTIDAARSKLKRLYPAPSER
jgi:hypothetical protein